MMRLAMVLTVLGLAAPALAEEATQAAVLSDAQLDQVAAGCDSTGTPTGVSTLPSTNTNINVSPIIVNQTAVAITQQNAKQNVTGKGNGNGKALGLLKQSASTVAMNYLNINYHPKF